MSARRFFGGLGGYAGGLGHLAQVFFHHVLDTQFSKGGGQSHCLHKAKDLIQFLLGAFSSANWVSTPKATFSP